MPTYEVTRNGRTFQVTATSPNEASSKVDGVTSQSADPMKAISGAKSIGPVTLADKAVDALPNVGGVVGSFAGAGKWNPLGMAGAALGGAGGEAVKDIANAARGRGYVPHSTGELAADMASAGAVQGGIQGIGNGLVAPIAKGIYATGMLPLKALRDKYGLSKLISVGYKNNIMPTAGGAAKAGALVGASKAAQQGMETAYDAGGGAPLSTLDAARRGVKPLMDQAYDVIESTGTKAEAPRRIAGSVRSVIGASPTRTAEEMGAAKRTADAAADPAYAAARRGGPAVETGSDAALAKGWSKGYRETLNDAVGPQYAAQGQNTKTLYGVQQMAKYRAEAPNQLAHHLMGAVALGGAGAATSNGDAADRLTRAAEFAAFASPSVRAGVGLAAPMLARTGIRGADTLAGDPLEQFIRQALIDKMTGGGQP